ncbi:VanZ family protein [Kitasatospora sp. NPDC093806]|uniref:VanZ family protein n=1 Tax=Kitasatospora sp. NPDC093806 TaxID=3155075 RepID=UPI00342D38AF
MIKTVLHGLPMFWPGLFASLVPAALLNRPVGRLLRAHWSVGFLLLLALGGVATLTLLPTTPRAFWQDLGWDGVVHHCTFGVIRVRPPGEWFTSRQADLNILMFAPIGVVAALAGSRRRAVAVLAAGAALPFVLEAAQYAAPAIGRACDAQDVCDCLVGLVLGAVVGALARPLSRTAGICTARR